MAAQPGSPVAASMPAWPVLAARTALAYALIPNLALWLVAVYLGVSRPLVNLDYLAIGVLVPWLPLLLGRLALSLALIIDLVLNVAPTYQFDLAKLLETVLELFKLPPAFVMPIIAGTVIGAIALSWLMLRLRPASPPRLPASLAALVCAVLVLGSDMLMSPNALVGKDQAVSSVNIAGSPGTFVAGALLNKLRGTNTIIVSAAPERASAPIVAALNAGQLPQKLVLVIVESWGLFKDERARAQIIAPLQQLAASRKDLTLTLGSTEFRGSTVNGELRELCGLRSNSIHLPDPQIPLQDCLPRQLAALGYHSTALHGYRGSMFNRLHWYPDAGFDAHWFDTELIEHLGHPSRCGATFPGVCDGDIPALINQQLDDPGNPRQFVYWLTLNAHLPIYESTDPRAAADCSQSPVTANDEQECRLLKLHRLVMQSLADMMAQRHDTALVIVGDHAPAFVAGTRRHALSPDHVPNVVLWPVAAPARATTP